MLSVFLLAVTLVTTLGLIRGLQRKAFEDAFRKAGGAMLFSIEISDLNSNSEMSIPVNHMSIPRSNNSTRGMPVWGYCLPFENLSYPVSWSSPNREATKLAFDNLEYLSNTRRMSIYDHDRDTTEWLKLRVCRQLQDIYINSPNASVGDDFLVAVAELPHLRSVFVANASFSDAGVRALSKNSSIRRVSIDGKGVTSDSLIILGGIQQDMWIAIGCNVGVTSEDVSQFSVNNPEKVVSYNGVILDPIVSGRVARPSEAIPTEDE